MRKKHGGFLYLKSRIGLKKTTYVFYVFWTQYRMQYVHCETTHGSLGARAFTQGGLNVYFMHLLSNCAHEES